MKLNFTGTDIRAQEARHLRTIHVFILIIRIIFMLINISTGVGCLMQCNVFECTEFEFGHCDKSSFLKKKSDVIFWHTAHNGSHYCEHHKPDVNCIAILTFGNILVISWKKR